MLPDIETDPIKYMKLRNLAEINSGVNPSAVNYTQAQIDEYQAGMKLDPSVYPASDWFDICLRNGFVQQHNLRLSGGVDALTYTIGLGYTDQTGILIANDDAQRYGLDFKLDARVNDKLKVGATFQGNIRKFNEVGYGTSTIMNVMTRALPIFSDYHKNGLYGSTWLFTPGRNNIENPRMEVEQGFTFRDYQELLSTIYTEWNITKDIKYFATFGFRKYDHFSKDFIPQMYTVNPKTGDTKLFNSNTPRLKEWDSMMQQITFSHRVVWEKTFAEKHDAHLMIGNEYFDYQARNFQAYNHGFNDNTLHEFGALTDQTNAQATGGSAFKRDVSVFGRAAYTYDEKYMLEATLRYDGSSLLAPGYRWALFPSALLGWRIDRESFFNVRQIDLLKIRLSAGVLGNPSVSNYAYQMTYDPISQNYSFGGNIASGYAVSALTDETLTWEKTSTYNVGIDFTAFRHRFTLEANLAYKHTSGMLLTLTIPDHVGGLSGPKSNVGTMENKGFEVMASWRDNISNFSYGVSGSVSYFKNKVLELNTDQILSNGDRNITKVGYPHNSFYLLEAVGYYQSQAEIDDPNTPIYGGSRANLKPGYIRYADKNNDKIIDVDNDKIITGNSIPFLTYSFNLHLGYKNISLDAMFQGIGDCYVYPTNNIAFPFYNGAGVTRDWETESWSENNRNAKYPLLTISNTTKANFEDSTHWLHNTKYLRMKNVQLTYSFPEKWLSRAKIDRLQLYLSGQNLLTFTNFKLWDPEIATNATNIYQYPNMKTVSIGLNLTF